MTSAFWERYLEYRQHAAPYRRSRRSAADPVCSGAVSYGDDAESCDETVRRIISRQCTAVISSLDQFQSSGRPIPAGGEYRILLDSAGRARCVLLSERSRLCAFRSIPEEIALREGLDRSFEAWRSRHREILIREAARNNISFSLDVLMVVDAFQLVYFESDDVL